MAELAKIIVGGVTVNEATVEINNAVATEFTDSLRPIRFISSTFEASVTVDTDSLAELLPGVLYNVEIVTDHNPWHGEGHGLRRLCEGLWWTFRRVVLRRSLVETTRLTVPDCRLEAREV